MKKYIQLQDSYDSKKGDIWEQITIYGYTNKLSKIFIENTTIESNPNWFAPYEEKKQYARSWEELNYTDGYHVGLYGRIEYILNNMQLSNMNIYATRNQANAALAEAQLSQLLKEIYEGENWFPDWKDGEQDKYCVFLDPYGLRIVLQRTSVKFIALPTEELAEQFLKNHRDLIETYFKKYEW